MAKHLFTFLCEIGGGTYIAQARASDVVSAACEWASSVRKEKWVDDLSGRVADVVIRELGDPDSAPVPLTGLSGVWCMGGLIDDDQYFLNIVKSAWAPMA